MIIRWVDNVYVLHKKQMIGDTQVIKARGYDLGLLDSYYVYYQAMSFV
jgi:hypothetical protein